MKVILTGSSGFVGSHVLNALERLTNEITCLIRDDSSVKKSVNYIKVDINEIGENFKVSGDVLIHCAWPEVSNVHSNKHIDEYYKKNLEFIEKIINFGVKKIIVIGSCYEYGLQYGPMFVSTETRPNTPYAKSKDKLHKSLRIMADQLNSFELIWARLFYIYGPGQGKKSIFSQLTEAINSKEEYFKMSYGEQLLDYLPVEIVAEKIVELIDENPGTYNICSGEPISLRRFIENRIKTLNSDIKLVLGYYPYRKDDSNAIWGGDPY